ncbi:phospholipase-like protein [Artemisia annua]|uniref:Phospholipase-like protein n=1 Tax=Artemisia annua TaxID=35608 RepID=A0A2U1KGK1_ARTAN|nr:phospholipase-like protein [Artemisia annua]
MDVNISVACCICDVLRIMEGNAAYTNEQMKDFFELVVTTFEKLSSATGGCYTKVFKVLKTLSGLSFSVLESDLRLNGLIIRLFKQFLAVADSNSDDVVLEMKKILTIIIEESEPLNLKLVDPLVTSVRKENQITSPVCWKLGNEVLEKYAAKLKPHIQDKVAKEEWDSLRDSILSTTDTRKLTKNAIRKMKLGCPDGSRNRVQPFSGNEKLASLMVASLMLLNQVSLVVHVPRSWVVALTQPQQFCLVVGYVTEIVQVDKAAASTGYTVDKSASGKDNTVEKVAATKDYSVEKANEGKYVIAGTIVHLKSAFAGTARKVMALLTRKKEVAKERLSETRKAIKVSRM